MRLELAERLCCPAPHAPSPLIVVAERVAGRVLEHGVAGCPICRLEAAIAEGLVRFSIRDGATSAPAVPDSSGETALPPTAERLDRTIALLGLAEPGGYLLLSGRYRPLARAIAARVETHVVIWEPTTDPLDGELLSGCQGAGDRVPFSDQTFRAAAVDETMSAALQDLARTMTPNGRLLTPATLAPIPGTRELARDAEESIAEPAGAVIELRRRL